jgi:hypothetical protein
MTTRFRPFPPVNSAYGAPMGRRSAQIDINFENDSASSLAIAGPAYEYDAGGAYWGLSYNEGPVWAVWRKGKGSEGVVYIRALNRAHAKSKALCAPSSI